MPFGFLHSITDFFTPKPVSLREKNTVGKLIEAVNDCGEKRYIEVAAERNYHQERQQDLEILLTKCKRLLSFVESRGLENKFATTLIDFGNEIEFYVQNKCDLEPMFEKYEKIKKVIKGNYMSSSHLSGNYIYENIHLS